MKFFGIEIKRLASDTRAALTLAPSWTNGIQWLGEKDFLAMVRAYKSWIYICASKNAMTVSKQCLNLFAAKPTGKKSKILVPHKSLSFQQRKNLSHINQIKNLASVRKAAEIVEVTEHPFLDLLDKCNPFMSGTDLIEMTSLYQELTGNAYWYIVRDDIFGLPLQIWSLPSQFVRIVPSSKDIIAGYIYRQHAVEIPFDVNEIIHFKYPNPSDNFYGISPLMAISDAYNTNENILRFTNALFSNMARPEGVLHTDQELTEADFIVLKKQWNEAYGGVSKTRKTAVLPKGLSYSPITMTPQELDFVDGRGVVKEEICNAYGQSVALYSEKANRANSEQAYLSFLRDTIKPRLRRIEETINSKLIGQYDKNAFVAFENPVPDDKEFRLKEIEANLRNGYSSINEERQIDGRNTVAWGDVPLMSQTIVPLGSVKLSPSDSSSLPPDSSTGGSDSKFFIRSLIKRLKDANV